MRLITYVDVIFIEKRALSFFLMMEVRRKNETVNDRRKEELKKPEHARCEFITKNILIDRKKKRKNEIIIITVT